MKFYKNLVVIFFSFFLLAGCGDFNPKEDEKLINEVLEFWSLFQDGDFDTMKDIYKNEITLLPRSALHYELNHNRDSMKSKKYSREEVFVAYTNLKKGLSKEKWQYIFHNLEVNKNNIEISTVKHNKVTSYIAGHDSRVSSKDIVFVVKMNSKSHHKLIFVFSRKDHKIIAQAIVISSWGSYLRNFPN